MVKWIKGNPFIFAIMAMAGGCFAYYIYLAIRWLPYPNSIDFGEGFVMNYARMWADGTWKWNINVPPYFTMVYGLGYPILIEPLVKLFGSDLWVGRVVSFGSTLVVCGLLYLIVKELTGKWYYGLITALLPFTQPIIRDWSPMARVDMPAVMFDMIGFYLVVKFRKSPWLIIAVIPFICAIMIKLTAVAGLLAVVMYLAFYKRVTIVLSLSVLILGLVPLFVLLEITISGEYLKQVMVYQKTIQNFVLPTFMVLWNAYFYAFIPLFIGALVYIKKYWSRGIITLAGFFFIIAFAIDNLTAFRAGAAEMYYYEAIMAGCLCFGLFLPYLNKAKMEMKAILVGVFALCLVIFGLSSNMSFPPPSYDNAIAQVKNIINDTQKPIVTENPTLVTEAGKELYIEPFVFTNLARLGYWDETGYINDYKSQFFDYVILKVSYEQKMKWIKEGFPDGCFTDGVMKALGENYSLVYQSNVSDWRCSLYVYEAKNKLRMAR